MGTEPFKVVARFLSTPEAELAQAALQNAGIQAFVEAAEANVTLSHMGAGLRGVKLLATRSQWEAARKELGDLGSHVGDVPEWKCPRCGSAVDAGFEICWCCGLEHVPMAAEN